MKVPVKVIVDTEDKSFEVEVGTPTTSALIVKELGIEKGSATPNTAKVGDLSPEAVIRIAQKKHTNRTKDPKEFIKELDTGVYDEQLKTSG